MTLLQGQVILVTGSSRGLGRALVKEFAGHGAAVIINYRADRQAAEALRAELVDAPVLTVQADITSETDVNRMLEAVEERFGRLDALVNNALPDYRFDPAARQSFPEIGWSAFQAQLEGTLGGAYHVTKAALPLLEASGGGVLNILSNLVTHPVVAYHDYTAAKAALWGFTRTLAAELGPKGVRVNALAPGLLETTDASSATPPEVFELIRQSTPLRRVTTPGAAAAAAVPFVSRLFSAVTGQYLAVDGGLTMP